MPFNLPSDPWRAFEPTRSNPWTYAKVAHLYRRAAFGASPSDIEQGVNRGMETVEHLFQPTEADAFEKDAERLGKTILANRNPRSLPAWWIYRMVYSPYPLLEKMTLFWHGHFATSADKVNDAKAMLHQNRLLRKHALGHFRPLVQAISRDVAMLIYLDSTDNRKTHPNENFARELLELFCLGLGNYTEKDIQELARCFTGWQVRRGKFRFSRHQHDFGTKKIFGKTGNFNGDEAVDIVLAQPEAEQFLAVRLYRYFITDQTYPTEDIVRPLAKLIRDTDFNMRSVVRTILQSRIFYSEIAIGKKIRSPVDLAIGFLRTFGATANLLELSEHLERLGQLPFYPPNVKGWDGGRKWINTSLLLGRANLVRYLLGSQKSKWKNGDLVSWLNKNRSKSPQASVDLITNTLFAVPLEPELKRRFTEFANAHGIDEHHKVADLINAICLQPEFQLA